MQSVEICGKKAAYLCGRLAVQRRGVRIYDGKSYERQFQLKRWLKSVKIVTPAEDGRSLWVYYADGELSKVNIKNFTCEKQVKICLKPALHRFSAVEMQSLPADDTLLFVGKHHDGLCIFEYDVNRNQYHFLLNDNLPKTYIFCHYQRRIEMVRRQIISGELPLIQTNYFDCRLNSLPDYVFCEIKVNDLPREKLVRVVCFSDDRRYLLCLKQERGEIRPAVIDVKATCLLPFKASPSVLQGSRGWYAAQYKTFILTGETGSYMLNIEVKNSHWRKFLDERINDFLQTEAGFFALCDRQSYILEAADFNLPDRQ